jgi:hypothetical protein
MRRAVWKNAQAGAVVVVFVDFGAVLEAGRFAALVNQHGALEERPKVHGLFALHHAHLPNRKPTTRPQAAAPTKRGKVVNTPQEG